VRSLPLIEQLRVTSWIGGAALTIGPREYRALRETGVSAGDILHEAADAGVEICHIDPFIRWVPDAALACGHVQFAAHPAEDELFRMAEELGASSVSVVGMFPERSLAPAQVVDCFGAFGMRAAAHGLRCDLEFVPIWGIPDLAAAWEIISAAGGARSGIMFDIWHYSRGNPDDELLQRIPGRYITGVQLSDGTARLPPGRDALEDTRHHRLPPGKGEFRVREVIALLRRSGGLNNAGPEIFSAALDRLAPQHIAQICRDAMDWALD
jgi:sugar phosphate isomerase/epimerase